MPAAVFHWIRVQTFCYATERKELLEETMETLLGDADEFSEDESVGEHGNVMTILEARLTHQRQYRTLFANLGPELREEILEDLDNRIDEDCVFYVRLDKQKAVQGMYEIAHHGDVIAVTGKVQAHPARKDVAVRTVRSFLEDEGQFSERMPEGARGPPLTPCPSPLRSPRASRPSRSRTRRACGPSRSSPSRRCCRRSPCPRAAGRGSACRTGTP